MLCLLVVQVFSLYRYVLLQLELFGAQYTVVDNQYVYVSHVVTS